MSEATVPNEAGPAKGIKFTPPAWTRVRWGVIALLAIVAAVKMGVWWLSQSSKSGAKGASIEAQAEKSHGMALPSALVSVNEAASVAGGGQPVAPEHGRAAEEADFPAGSARYYVDPDPDGFTASLKIEVKGKDAEGALIKLISKESGKPIALLYASGKHPLMTALPPGMYLVHYAVGKTWFGEDGLFGAGTGLYSLNKPMDLLPAKDGETPAGTLAISDEPKDEAGRTPISRDHF